MPRFWRDFSVLAFSRMNFWTRFGWSLLFFGIVALVASFFGYVPRKLANLNPTQVKTAAIAFVVLGGFALALGGDSETRRKLLRWFGWVAAAVAVGFAALFVIGYFASKRRFEPLPGPTPVPGWTAPPPPAGMPPEAAAMNRFYQKRSGLEARFGRGKTWSVVVHLAGSEPPTDLESKLGELAQKNDGDVAVARMGGMVHATLAPIGDAGALTKTLEGLFPGAQVQVMDPARQAVVFARMPAPSR